MRTLIFLIIWSLVWIFNTNSEEALSYYRIPTNQSIIYDMTYSENGKVLLVADGSEIKWFDSDDFGLLATSSGGHNGAILTLAISKDSSIMISGGQDSTIVVWDIQKNQVSTVLSYHQGMILSVSLSKDKRYLISGGTDNKVILYDLQERVIKGIFTNHNRDVTVVKFSPDDNSFFSGGGDKKIFLFDKESGRLLDSVRLNGWVRDLSFSQSGKELLVGGDFSKVFVFSLAGGLNFRNFAYEQKVWDWTFASRFHPIEDASAFGGLQGSVRIETDKSTYKADLASPITDLEFDPNAGQQLRMVVATRGKGVFLLEASDMKVKVK
jgi:WD40 repeat protein